MTDDEKLDAVVEFLTTARYDTLCPYDHVWIGDTLVVASLNYDQRPQADVYDRTGLLDWVDRAIALDLDDSYDFASRLYESDPPRAR